MELLPSLLSTLRSAAPAALDHEYTAVRSQTLSRKRDQGLTTEVGALKENIKKNRYKDILPYDQSRVVLSLLTTDTDSDYINASFIKGATPDKQYIASQGPLSSTVVDFWRMIWQHDVKVIVMACREVEMGKKKCECYWAPEHHSTQFGSFTVHNQEETCPTDDIVIRTLTVTYQQVTRSLVQYQFLSWPDHDVPYESTGVLDLLDRVRESHRTHTAPLLVTRSLVQYQFLSWPDHDVPYESTGVLDLLDRVRESHRTHTAPLLVHCSAGCGRTGVICALDYIHDLLVTKQVTSDFSIMEIVLQLRTQRSAAVQTKDQYQFIFTAASCLLERVLQASNQQQLYSNVTQLKKPEKKTTKVSTPFSRRSSKVVDMNDTYAVVNKPKQPHPPPAGPAPSAVAPPRTSRTLPPSHHYDNESLCSSAPIYSSVRPRAKQQTLPASSTAVYDVAAPVSQRDGLNGKEYQLVSADQPPPVDDDDDDYEEFSTSVTSTPNFCSSGGIGFNGRVQKPRGPRDPPAEWSRLER